jgi:hypothetical protein
MIAETTLTPPVISSPVLSAQMTVSEEWEADVARIYHEAENLSALPISMETLSRSRTCGK